MLHHFVFNSYAVCGHYVLSLWLICVRNVLIMPNKARGSELWSEILQTSVTPEIKNKVNQLAVAAGVSNSEIVRSLIDQALEEA